PKGGRERGRAAGAGGQAERAPEEKTDLAHHLYDQVALILGTRREARGLVVSLSDVLFDTGHATLKPGAREKLSKLAGILLAYPGSYKLEITGHTDSVGSDELNMRLSEQRAASVQTYLLAQEIPPDRMVAIRGLGKTI